MNKNRVFNLSTILCPTLSVNQNKFDMDEKMLSLEQEIKIKEKALKLKEEKKLRKICPMVVFGDTANGEKEIYVAYMSEPSFPQFSKFMAASKKDEVIAMRTLARDCFVDGDKELVDDESLFLFGLMGQLSELITSLFIIYTRRLQTYVHLPSQMVYYTYEEFPSIYLIYL